MARLSGAVANGTGQPDIGRPQGDGFPPSAQGSASLARSLFGPLARAQYTALTAMRWCAFRNSLRSSRGVLEATLGGVSYLIYILIGLSVTAGLAAGSYVLASKGAWSAMPTLTWVVFFMWQVLPISMAFFHQQFDLNGLLRFPVGFGEFFVLHLIFGLVDASTILGGLCCLGILGGITAAESRLFLPAAIALAVFAAFNVLLARAIFAWLDRWLAQRKTREILTALFLVAMLGLQLFNPSLRHRATGQHRQPVSTAPAAARHRLAEIAALQSWLPPGAAAMEMRRTAEGRILAASASLGLLALYGLAAGSLLALRLRAEFRGEDLGEAPARRKLAPKPEGRTARAASSTSGSSTVAFEASRGGEASGLSTTWMSGSGPIAAILEKELRTVMRSMPLLYALGAPLVMVLIFGSILRGAGPGAPHAIPMAVPICVAYALLGFTQLIYNNLGAEGAAVQLLFLSPTPIRTVLLAKNLFHTLLFAAIALAAGGLAMARLGDPGRALLAASVAWVLFALPAHLAVGNIFSLTMPYRVNLTRIGRQRGSQASALLSILVQLAILGVGALVFGLSAASGHPWIAAPVLLLLAGGAVLCWLRVLSNANAMASRRKDELIATLARAD